MRRKPKRKSIEMAKKIRSHVQEWLCFVNQRGGAIEAMLDAFIEEEQTRKRKED